jgi:hypothetical protein
LAAFAAQAPAAVEEAVYTAEQLRAMLRAQTERVKSLSVEYRSDPASGKRDGSYVHRIVAVKSPWSMFHSNAHGHAHLDWRDDPYQQQCYVTRDRWFNPRSIDRHFYTGVLRPEDPLPGSMPNEFFFAATGLWPLDRPTPKFRGEPHMLRDVAGDDRYSLVRPALETVNGRACHVLERVGHDRLWLDAARGAVVVARERTDPEPGELVQRIECLDYQEIQSDIWMPTRFRNVQYRDTRGERVISIDGTSSVRTIHVNDVDDDVFSYTPPPGALRIDENLHAEQVVPGGEDLINDLGDWMRRHAMAPKQNDNAWARAGLLLIAGAVGFEVWLRRATALRFGRRMCGLLKSGRREAVSLSDAAEKS